MAENHEFRVSATELDYFNQLASNDESFARLLKFGDDAAGRQVVIRLSSSQAEQLREYLMARMDVVGFDENYEPTPEGRMLEDLIDRFFIPRNWSR